MRAGFLKRYVFVAFAFSLVGCVSSQGGMSMLFKALVFDEIPDATFTAGYTDTIEIDEADGVVRYSGGRRYTPLLDCGDDAWLCISDGHIEFAVRRDWRGEEDSWVYRDMAYSVLRSSSRREYIVDDTSYYILASPQSELAERTLPKVFLYSTEKGITAITMFLQGYNEVLVPTTYVRVDSVKSLAPD